jgi:hypothetical protein
MLPSNVYIANRFVLKISLVWFSTMDGDTLRLLTLKLLYTEKGCPLSLNIGSDFGTEKKCLSYDYVYFDALLVEDFDGVRCDLIQR